MSETRPVGSRIRLLTAGIVVAATSGLSLVGLAGPAAAASCGTGFTLSGSTCTATFSFVGSSVQTIAVPSGAKALIMSLSGAQGGYSADNSPPGAGGTETGTVPVTPGETLSVVVGGAGGSGSGATNGPGGYGGGGSQPFADSSGGGGGGSFVFDPSSALLAAAGGGGGAGFDGSGLVSGGNGGGATGGTGTADDLGDSGGSGGSQNSTGGTGGASSECPGGNGTGPATSSTSFGTGGNGNNGCSGGGGGGGGGYFGGGAGGGVAPLGAAGGGGSGFLSATATDTSSGTASLGPVSAPSNGAVVLSYTPVTLPTGASHTWTTGVFGTVTVNATGTPTPTITHPYGQPGDGKLPNGLTQTFAPGSVTFSGTPAANSGGTYNIKLVATNPTGTATEYFTINVLQPPVMSLPNDGDTVGFKAGVASSVPWSVTAPATTWPHITQPVRISVTGLQPSMTFTNNGNGTGTISGTLAEGTYGPMSIKASNVAGSSTTTFYIKAQ